MKLRLCRIGFASFAFLLFTHSSALAQGRTWTADADFDGGVLDNVVHATADQLDLGPTAVSQGHTVWAINYLYGYVVRMDTVTGKQTARYDSVLQIVNGSPSGARPPREYCDFSTNGNCPGRAAVDTSGDVWIVNRAFGHQGTMTKIAGDITRCVDRNGNLAIETSTDTNDNGIIDVTSPTEFLGQNDECILTTFPVGPNNRYPRSIAIDKNGKVWAGTHTDGTIYRFNPNPPYALEATVTVGGNPYSAAAGGDYILISNSAASGTKRVHITTLAVNSVACPATYGLVATPAGDVAWLGGYFAGTSQIYKADFTANTCTGIAAGGNVTAMTLDLDGNVWAASYNTNVVVKYNPAGVLIGSYPAGGSSPHGLAVDFDGYIWTILHSPPSLSKIDSATGALIGTYTIGGPGIPNADPYLYGDYTGAQLDKQIPYTPAGNWDGTHDGGVAGIAWSTVRWNSEAEGAEPAGTALVVSVRAADTLPALSAAVYTPTGNGDPLVGISGRFVQVLAEMTGPGSTTPTLSDITVEGPCPSLPADCLDAAKSSLLVKDAADDSKDLLKWKWGAGPEVLQTDLGDPLNSTTYTLCLYDSTGGVDFAVGSLRIDPNAGWADKDPKGWSYKDATGVEDGVAKASLKTGADGKSKAGVGAKGLNIPMPAPLSGTELFDLDTRVTVQLFNDATPTCWSSEFTVAKKNTGAMFKAKAP